MREQMETRGNKQDKNEDSVALVVIMRKDFPFFPSLKMY